jgi:hypothetical protein
MRKWMVPAAALVSLAWFLTDAAERGWSKRSTDFPNYYTAATLARTHTQFRDQSLRNFYDWPWFQRQISFMGFGQQLGGYIPQTPLAMAPYIPVSFLPPLQARRAWFVLNCIFLGVACLLISRITQFSTAGVWLLAFLGSATLRPNFELGQYYVFLLMLFSLAAWYLERGKDMRGGVVLGTAIALKLYGAPLLLLAFARRRWQMLWGAVLALVVALTVAAAAFGWKDLGYYATAVLPRTLGGETLDPYHLSNGTAATLLRRWFLFEAELNPHPLIESTAAFYFLWTAFTLLVLLLPALASRGEIAAPSKRTLAWWLIGMLLVSPNTASYTFALAILPVALLLDALPRRYWLWILIAFFLLTVPLRPAWSRAFPRVWLLLFLFAIAGYPELKRIPVRTAGVALAALFVFSAGAAAWQTRASAREPWRHYPLAVNERGAIYSSAPQSSRAGLIYESIGPTNYLLRRDGRTFSFAGHALHPTTPDEGFPVYFELVSGASSRIMSFDERSSGSAAVAIDVPDAQQPTVSHGGRLLTWTSGGGLFLFDGARARRIANAARDASFTPGDRGIVFIRDGERNSIEVLDLVSMGTRTAVSDSVELASPSVSPDGRELLFSARRHGNMQVRVADLWTGKQTTLTGGNCNNYSPIWSGSEEIVFASDCRRGLGLPALYRARLNGIFK